MSGSRSTRWARVARGFALAAASLFVASMSHVAAGAHAPGPLALGLALALSLVVCTAIVGRTLTLPRLVIGVAISQLLLHLLFSLDGRVGGPAMSVGHHGTPISLPAGRASAVAVDQDLGMWIAHAVAALITVALIRWGHLTGRAIQAFARPFIERVHRVVAPPVAPRVEASVPCRSRDAASPPQRPWTRSLSRRGPPLLSY